MSDLYDAYMVGQGFVSQARLEQAVRDARREALEEAARIAEARDLSIMSSTVVDVEARKIAAAIRALMEPGNE